MRSFARAVMLAVAIGAVLGAAGQYASELNPGMRWVVALGVPWLLTAFAAGAMVGDRVLGALAGITTLVVGTLVYYAVRISGGGGFVASDLTTTRAGLIVAGWCAASVAGGAAFGLAGAAWRTGNLRAHVTAVSLAGGALVGEALLLMHEWAGRGARSVLAAELAVGIAAPLVLTRERRWVMPALALSVAVALVVAGAESEVRSELRDLGWNGA